MSAAEGCTLRGCHGDMMIMVQSYRRKAKRGAHVGAGGQECRQAGGNGRRQLPAGPLRGRGEAQAGRQAYMAGRGSDNRTVNRMGISRGTGAGAGTGTEGWRKRPS